MTEKINRSKKALYNTGAAFLSEIISIICGLILPRLIITAFGSEYNGIITSVTRFISLISVLNAGISVAARAMFYKPLAKGDLLEISRVVEITENSTRKIAYALIVFTILLAISYSAIIDNTFDFKFTSSLILITAVATFSQYYIALPYEILLYADQKHRIVSFIHAGNTTLSTLCAVIIIYYGGTIHLVKLAAVIISIGSSFLLKEIVRKKYKVIKMSVKKNERLTGRRYAVGQGISDYINSNVDVIVLSLFTGLKQVSIYSVYSMVITATSNIIVNVISSFGAAFGNMYARKEYELLRDNMRLYELVVFSLSSVIFSVTLSLIVPFIKLYTSSVTDISYDVPVFSFVLVLAAEFMSFRIPYETVSKAVGHFKQTRVGAYIEAGLNLIISIVAVLKFGLVGVAMGTLISSAVRSFDYAYYLGNHIIKRNFSRFIGNVFRCLSVTLIIYVLSFRFTNQISSWWQWIMTACILTIMCSFIVLTIDFIFYNKDLKLFIRKLYAVLRNKEDIKKWSK